MNWIRHKLRKILTCIVLYHYQEALHGYFYYPAGTLAYAGAEFHHRLGDLYYEIRKAIK